MLTAVFSEGVAVNNHTMEKEYNTIHIVAVSEHNGEYPEHGDWFYQLRPEKMNKKPLDKIFKRRSDATRFGKKVAYNIEQWYPV